MCLLTFLLAWVMPEKIELMRILDRVEDRLLAAARNASAPSR